MMFSKLRSMVRNPIIISLMCSSAIVSCKESTTKIAPVDTKKTDIVAIGVNHNKGLDYMLTYLKAHAVPGKTPVSEIMKLAQTAAYEFTVNAYPNLTKQEREQIGTQINNTFKMFKGYFVNKAGRTAGTSVQDTMNELAPYASSSTKETLNLVFDAVRDQECCIGALFAELDAIEATVSGLPSGEQDIVYGAISTARSSAQYWADNQYLWASYIRPDGTPYELRTSGKISWGGVGAMDVAGAVIVGIGNAWASIGGPLGWGYWVGSVVVGAVVSSGAMALIYLISYSYDQSYSGIYMDDYSPRLHIPVA